MGLRIYHIYFLRKTWPSEKRPSGLTAILQKNRANSIVTAHKTIQINYLSHSVVTVPFFAWEHLMLTDQNQKYPVGKPVSKSNYAEKDTRNGNKQSEENNRKKPGHNQKQLIKRFEQLVMLRTDTKPSRGIHLIQSEINSYIIS